MRGGPRFAAAFCREARGCGTITVAARLPREHLELAPPLQQIGLYLVECTLDPTMALHKNPVLLGLERDAATFIPTRHRRDDLAFDTLGSITPERDASRTRALKRSCRLAGRADERGKLERLCRTISRPAVSQARLSLSAGGLVRYQLKTPYPDGTTHVLSEPLDFIARPAARAARSTCSPTG